MTKITPSPPDRASIDVEWFGMTSFQNERAGTRLTTFAGGVPSRGNNQR